MVISALCYIKDGKISDVSFHNVSDKEVEINKMSVNVEDYPQADYILYMARPVLTHSEQEYMVSQMFDKFKELVFACKLPYQVTGKDNIVVPV
jgi:hypothetical protein